MLRTVIVSAVVLGLLGACSAPREGPAGRVEVNVQGPCEGARGGQLRLEGDSTIVLSARELCQGSLVRELPAGPYRMAWQASAEDDAAAPATLRGTALLSVLAGRSTLVRLTLETAPSPLDTIAREEDEHAPPMATCSYVARGGPS
jgi:hypothetical protein